MWEYISTRDDLTGVRANLQIAGYMPQLLNASMEVTIFLPNDLAFNNFAASLGKTGPELAAFPLQMLQVLSYHYVPGAVSLAALAANPANLNNTVRVTTQLGRAETYAGIGVRVPADGNISNTIVYGSSSSARLLAADVRAGAAYVNIVDTMLQFWYTDLAAAITATPSLSSYAAVAKDVGLLTTLANPALTYTLFGPSNDAYDKALNNYGIDFRNNSANANVAPYHVATVPMPLLGYSKAEVATLSPEGRTLVVDYRSYDAVNVTCFGGITAKVLASSIPVGFQPSSFIHIIDEIMIPTYTSVWQYLSSGPDNASFSPLRTLLAAEGSVKSVLSDYKSTITFLAPSTAALTTFAATLGRDSNITTALGTVARQAAVLRTLVVTAAYKLAAFVKGNAYTTLGSATLRINSTAAGVVVFEAENSTATAASPSDVSILYGKSYVQTINYVLISKAAASQLTTGGGGAATAASPSLLLTCVALLTGLLAMRALRA